MKNSILVSFAFIAAVIGAGFASGAEVVSYFLVFGKESLVGIVLAGILFSVFAYMLMDGCFRYRTYVFSDYIEKIMPPLWQKFTTGTIFIFMLVCLSAMSAAAGEMIGECFFVNKAMGTIIFSVLCSMCLYLPVACITRLNGILGGVIGVGIIFCCWYIMNYRFEETFNSFAEIGLSTVSYVAYNGIGASVMLCSMSRFLKNKKEIMATAILSGAGITLILAALWCVVGIYYGKVNLGEIPMLTIAKRQGMVFYTVYAVILFLSVLTTAISNGFGVIEFIKTTKLAEYGILIVLMVMVFLSEIGFYAIVDGLYRLCGYFSTIFFIFMAKNYVKIRKK